MSEHNDNQNKTTAELISLIDDLSPAIRERIEGEIANELASSIKYSLSQHITGLAKTYIEKQVLPKVTAKLEEEKDALAESIMEAVRLGAQAVGQSVTAYLEKEAEDTMKGYRGRDILKNILGLKY